ncbi:hypothetical protein DFP72DRAFT_616887 [Ephemerocybe angulata]|uniref:Uncharacterized protein n=1 Tax=Ephemerocybe angulata TaxID=980116 RepID=A0A8H6M053_9AGAR|nr:hypothetical protein DFP72DRAFT_616887 [Tulosesus angulatus]
MSAEAPIPKLRTRKSARKGQPPPSAQPIASTSKTPLGAAAAILASSSHAATLPPSALSAPGRRFTRSALVSLDTQQPEPPSQASSPLSPTSPLSPLTPPGSPLSTTSSLGSAPLSPNEIASAQTQSKSPAKLASTMTPMRRIATRSSGLPLVEGEFWIPATRKRSPLAFPSGSTAPSTSTPSSKGKGKAAPKRSGMTRPSRRSSRLSGVSATVLEPSGEASTSAPSTSTSAPSSPLQSRELQLTPAFQHHSPPNSPPSLPPLRLSLASLSPPQPSSQRKPHTRSPLSGSSSSGLLGSHSGSGTTSPLKETASFPSKDTSSTGTTPNPNPTTPSNAAQNLPSHITSHTPPGSPTRSGSQMEIDAVDFGTVPRDMMLPGPSLALSQVGVFGPGIGGQTSPPTTRQDRERQERPGSPTSPTERKAVLGPMQLPLMPSTLLAVAAPAVPSTSGSNNIAADKEGDLKSTNAKAVEEPASATEGRDSKQKQKQKEVLRDSGVVEENVVPVAPMEAVAAPELEASSVDTASSDNASLQPIYPSLIQVEIPPAPQPQVQSERFEQDQFADASQAPGGEAPYQQGEQVQQSQYQQYAPPPPPPPPAYTGWEEPPRLDNERNLWRLACKVRVWDLRRRYSLETIRSLVTHEAHEYYAKNGFPTGFFTSAGTTTFGNAGANAGMSIRSMGGGGPSRLRAQSLSRQVSGSSTSSEGEGPTSPINFMDEEVYDWEIAMSDDEDEGLVDEDDDDDDDEDWEEDDAKAGEDRAEEGSPDAETKVEDEEERNLKRRRRRSSILMQLRKPSREADDTPSPGAESPAPEDQSKGEEKEDDVDAVDMDVDIDLDLEDLDEALEDPNFNLELSASTSASPTSPQPASPSPTSAGVAGQWGLHVVLRSTRATGLRASADSPC